MKKVTIYSTRGQKGQVIETSANTWGELQEDLTANGVEYDNMRAIIGENQVSLELASSVLTFQSQVGGVPSMSLILSPKTQKAGI